MELRERAGTADPSGVEDSLPLALFELKRHLRRELEKTLADALAIQCDLLAGYRRGEIQARLGLADADYVVALRCLRRVLDRMRDDAA